MNMGMERWCFLLSVVSSPVVYFLKTTRAVSPNINPIMLGTHICDVNYAACYSANVPSDPSHFPNHASRDNRISLEI